METTVIRVMKFYSTMRLSFDSLMLIEQLWKKLSAFKDGNSLHMYCSKWAIEKNFVVESSQKRSDSLLYKVDILIAYFLLTVSKWLSWWPECKALFVLVYMVHLPDLFTALLKLLSILARYGQTNFASQLICCTNKCHILLFFTLKSSNN